jgi:hypothetical protein
MHSGHNPGAGLRNLTKRYHRTGSNLLPREKQFGSFFDLKVIAAHISHLRDCL